MKEKFLYSLNPVRFIVTGPSDCGKLVFQKKFYLMIVNEFEGRYIYSPSPHQNIHQKLNKCPNNYIPINII